MAAETAEMTVLLEFEQCRRRVSFQNYSDAPKAVEDSLKQCYGARIVLVGADKTHVLQRWSREWGCYVDVLDPIEIETGDKLTVVNLPAVVNAVSENAVMASFLFFVVVFVYRVCEYRVLPMCKPHRAKDLDRQLLTVRRQRMYYTRLKNPPVLRHLLYQNCSAVASRPQQEKSLVQWLQIIQKRERREHFQSTQNCPRKLSLC